MLPRISLSQGETKRLQKILKKISNYFFLEKPEKPNFILEWNCNNYPCILYSGSFSFSPFACNLSNVFCTTHNSCIFCAISARRRFCLLYLFGGACSLLCEHKHFCARERRLIKKALVVAHDEWPRRQKVSFFFRPGRPEHYARSSDAFMRRHAPFLCPDLTIIRAQRTLAELHSERKK